VLQLPHPVVSVEYLNPFGFKDFEVDKLFGVDIKANDQRGRVYWIKNAGEHTVEELHKLLPGLEFLRATGELNAIREKTGKYGLNLRELARILENLE